MSEPLTLETLLSFIDVETIRLRQRYGQRLDGRASAVLDMVKLSEEVGELAQQVLAAQSIQRGEKAGKLADSTLAEEVADVLIVTLILARHMDVDVASALSAKIRKIEGRYKAVAP